MHQKIEPYRPGDARFVTKDTRCVWHPRLNIRLEDMWGVLFLRSCILKKPMCYSLLEVVGRLLVFVRFAAIFVLSELGICSFQRWRLNTWLWSAISELVHCICLVVMVSLCAQLWEQLRMRQWWRVEFSYATSTLLLTRHNLPNILRF